MALLWNLFKNPCYRNTKFSIKAIKAVGEFSTFHSNTLWKCCNTNSYSFALIWTIWKNCFMVNNELGSTCIAGYKIEKTWNSSRSQKPTLSRKLSVVCQLSIQHSGLTSEPKKPSLGTKHVGLISDAPKLQLCSLFLPWAGARTSHDNERTQDNIPASSSSNNLLLEFPQSKRGFLICLDWLCI